MDVLLYLKGLATSVAGPWGSPIWWLIGAGVVTIFLGRWARAIRSLLPFFGAFALIFMIMYALTGMGVIQWNLN